jgi:hypothetical protein
MSKRPKKIPYSIDTRTFKRTKELIVTNGGTGKKVLFLVSFHPFDQTDSTLNHLTKMIEDLYIMASHRGNLSNKDKLSGRMSGIGFRGGYEGEKTAGQYRNL